MKKTTHALILCALALAPNPALAQAHAPEAPQTTQPATPSPAPRAEAAGEVFVEGSGFKNRVFDVRHREPARLVAVLKGLGSGYRGATVSASNEFGTITVRDMPENIAVMEEALRRLDTPEPRRADVELHLHILLATNGEPAGGELPAELRNVVAQLRTALAYRSFSLVTSVVQRVREGYPGPGPYQVSGRGAAVVTLPPPVGSKDLSYAYHIRRVGQTTGVQEIELEGFEFRLQGLGDAGVSSDLTLKPGEQVVVGTAGLRGGGLVLVLSAQPPK